MLGSLILDVVIGVVFTLLAVSLASSAVTEGIASVLKLRQKTLRAGAARADLPHRRYTFSKEKACEGYMPPKPGLTTAPTSSPT